MLRANGIGVIFEKENINTLTESSEFLLTLFSGFAQAESESISKNVIWGIQKSREAGNVPFQYSKLRQGIFGGVFALLGLTCFLHHLPLAGPAGHLLPHLIKHEDKLHQAILEGINEFVQAGQGLGDELLDLASIVQQGIQ